MTIQHEQIIKGQLTCKCLMTSVDVYDSSLYITKSLPVRFKCVSYNYNNVFLHFSMYAVLSPALSSKIPPDHLLLLVMSQKAN